MSLTLVSVPIGDLEDITLRAIKTINGAELLIGEERKPLFKMLKALDLPRPENIAYLNEHSTAEDLDELVQSCYSKNVVLVTDCGTPGFCDPGAALVKACRKKGIPVTSNPGASSLMVLLSLSGLDLKEFYFRGFLPANSEKREQELIKLRKVKAPLVLMDTPYRLQKLLLEIKKYFPEKLLTLGLSLTQPEEKVIQIPVNKINLEKLPKKAEFILILS